MTKDVKTGECFRLDHLIKSHLEKLSSEKTATAELKEECVDIVIKVRNHPNLNSKLQKPYPRFYSVQLDGMTKAEMGAILRKFNMKSPLTNNDLTDPIEFNLMFATQIGPTGLVKGYDVTTFQITFE
jgi:glycyl-tRNA synthetase